MEEMKRNNEDQLRGAVEKTKLYNQDQAREVRRNLPTELEKGVGNLCGTHIEEEGMKVSASALHTTLQYYQVLFLVDYHEQFEWKLSPCLIFWDRFRCFNNIGLNTFH